VDALHFALPALLVEGFLDRAGQGVVAHLAGAVVAAAVGGVVGMILTGVVAVGEILLGEQASIGGDADHFVGALFVNCDAVKVLAVGVPDVVDALELVILALLIDGFLDVGGELRVLDLVAVAIVLRGVAIAIAVLGVS